MLSSIEMLAQQASRTDQQLLLHSVLQQQETNRLLAELITITSKGNQEEQEEIKRPELMKRMAALKNKPPGFHKWSNEQIIEHLKGAS